MQNVISYARYVRFQSILRFSNFVSGNWFENEDRAFLLSREQFRREIFERSFFISEPSLHLRSYFSTNGTRPPHPSNNRSIITFNFSWCTPHVAAVERGRPSFASRVVDRICVGQRRKVPPNVSSVTSSEPSSQLTLVRKRLGESAAPEDPVVGKGGMRRRRTDSVAPRIRASCRTTRLDGLGTDVRPTTSPLSPPPHTHTHTHILAVSSVPRNVDRDKS